MAQKPETRFKERILPLLKRLPFTYIEKIQQKSIRGTLDILMCVNGWYVALELKVDGELDPLQKRAMARITGSNGYAFETTPENFPQIYTFLKKLTITSHPCPTIPRIIH